MTQEALKLALEALKRATNYDPVIARAITAIKEALAQPEPAATVESVATVVSESGNQEVTMSWWHEPALPVGTKLYTTPPQRTWVGLTDEEMLEAIKPLYANPFLAHNALEVSRDEYQAIEAKLKERNT